MDDLKWLQAQTAEFKAWESFLSKFSGADKSRFTAQLDIDDDQKATAEIYFKEGPKNKYWPLDMRSALGFKKKYLGFQLQLTLYPVPAPQTIPAVNFAEKINAQIGETLNKAQKIYITPTDFFTTKYREISKKRKSHSEHHKTRENGSAARTWGFGLSS